MRWILCIAVALACGGEPNKQPQQPHQAQQAHQHKHEHKGPIGHRFEKADDWVPRFEGPERDAWQKPDEVVRLLAIEPGMVIADIGAGTGYFLPHLSRATGPDGRVLGLDIEPDMVRYMNERAAKDSLSNVQARVVEVDDPGLAAGSTDRILIVNTWHHIPDRIEYARKLAASLSERGAIYVVDFTMESKRGPPKAHRLPPEDVVKELAATGLDVSVETETLSDQYVVAARPAPKR